MIDAAFQLMGALANIKTGKAGVSDALVESVVERVFAHEERKSSVRPKMMKATGQTTLLLLLLSAAAHASHLFGGDAAAAEQVGNNLFYLAGGGGAIYGFGHGARSVEKMGGKA